jgi:hypothetical protein
VLEPRPAHPANRHRAVRAVAAAVLFRRMPQQLSACSLWPGLHMSTCSAGSWQGMLLRLAARQT